jgi:hypothetical protein
MAGQLVYRVGIRTAEPDGRIRLRLVRDQPPAQPDGGIPELDVIVPPGHDLDLVPADQVLIDFARPPF